MTDFRFSGGRKTNGPLIHALLCIQYEMILVHTLDIVLGNKEKLVPRFYH